MRGLRLAEHRGGIERRAPRPGKQLRGAKENGSTIFPRRAVPILPGVRSCLDRLLDVTCVALVHGGKNVILVVRHDGIEGLTRADFLASDHHRRLDLLRLHLLQAET
jgi:hypothetical protein